MHSMQAHDTTHNNQCIYLRLYNTHWGDSLKQIHTQCHTHTKSYTHTAEWSSTPCAQQKIRLYTCTVTQCLITADKCRTSCQSSVCSCLPMILPLAKLHWSLWASRIRCNRRKHSCCLWYHTVAQRSSHWRSMSGLHPCHSHWGDKLFVSNSLSDCSVDVSQHSLMMQKNLHYLQKVDYGNIHNATWYIHTNIQARMRALIYHTSVAFAGLPQLEEQVIATFSYHNIIP